MTGKTILAVLGGIASLTAGVIYTVKKTPKPGSPDAPVMFCSPFLEEYIGTRADKVVDEYMKQHPKEKLTNRLFHKILDDYQNEHPEVDLYERIE